MFFRRRLAWNFRCPPNRDDDLPQEDYLLKLKPIKGGIGEALLKKMGWREGHGLGKNEDGICMPIAVKFRRDSDKTGIIAAEEIINAKKNRTTKEVTVTIAQRGKNRSTEKPLQNAKEIKNGTKKSVNYVSALTEYCLRRKYKRPVFKVHSVSRDSRRLACLIKVFVDGEWYIPTQMTFTTRSGRQVAAKYCLEKRKWSPSQTQPKMPSYYR